MRKMEEESVGVSGAGGGGEYVLAPIQTDSGTHPNLMTFSLTE